MPGYPREEDAYLLADLVLHLKVPDLLSRRLQLLSQPVDLLLAAGQLALYGASASLRLPQAGRRVTQMNIGLLQQVGDVAHLLLLLLLGLLEPLLLPVGQAAKPVRLQPQLGQVKQYVLYVALVQISGLIAQSLSLAQLFHQ